MSEDENWDTPIPAAAPASASRRFDSGTRSNSSFYSKVDRDPLKLFLYGLEPNLGESGVRCQLTSTDCPEPTGVAFKVRTVKEDTGEVQKAFAFVEFASRKDAEFSFDALKKANVRLNYAKKSDAPSGIRAKVADYDFESFRKSFTGLSAKDSPSDSICKVVQIADTTNSPTVAQVGTPATISSHLPELKPPAKKMSSNKTGKWSIDAQNTEQLVGQLLVVLNFADDECKTCSNAKGVEHLHYVLEQAVLLDPVRDAPPEMAEICCAVCKSEKSLKKCTGCQATSYCSRSCQVRDWAQHRKICALSPSPSLNRTLDSPALDRSALMSPNGTLELIKEPLANGLAKMVVNGTSGDRVRSARKEDSVTARTPVSQATEMVRQIDVTDHQTPTLPTSFTRGAARVAESVSPKDGVASRRPGQMMREMLSRPLDQASPVEQKASPQPVAVKPTPPVAKPAAPVAAAKKDRWRSLELGKLQKALVVWQDEVKDEFFFLSGEEDIIYTGINPHLAKVNKADDVIPEVGMYCVARSVDDNEYYRAQIMSIRGDKALVLFIDYGNTNMLSVTGIKAVPDEIDPTTTSFLPQAVKITAANDKALEAIKHAYESAAELVFTPVGKCDGYYIIDV